MVGGWLDRCPAAVSVKEGREQGRYLYVNAAWERAFGRRAADAVGRTDRELWPEESAAALERADEAVRESGRPAEGLITLPGDPGLKQWISWRFPFPDHSGRLLLGGLSVEAGELSVPPHAEKPLEHRLVCESRSNLMGVIYGEDESILEANDVFLEMFGFSREDLAARRLSLAGMAAPSAAQCCQECLRELESTGLLRLREVDLVRADGAVLPVAIGGAVLDRNPRLSWVLYVLDVAEQRRAERRLRRDEAWERLGLMAAGLAHDFNNLLVVIIGNASMASSDPSLSHKAQAHVREVLQAAELAATLVRQMLVYSGKARITPARVMLHEVVRQVVAAETVPAGVVVEMDISEGLPAVSGDPAQLWDAVRSLVVNAIEAAGPGGAVRVSVNRCRLDEPAAYPDTEIGPGDYVCASVSDTGSGIDEQMQTRIFDPFFTTKFHGRGLGLAAAYGIVRRHGGGIHVESAPGRGSRFQILVPAARD